MAILDRVKQRIETDIADAELQLMIDEANQTIVSRFGPHANPANPIVELLEGWRKQIVLSRAADMISEVREITTEYGWGETVYILTITDYRMRPGGYVLDRLSSGTVPRSEWASQVQVTYIPANDDGDQREEVIIKLVILTVQYEPLSSKTIGDVQNSNLDYSAEREKILSALQSRPGLTLA